MMNFLIG